MYLRALRWGLGPEAGRDEDFRNALREEASQIGWPALHTRLAGLDPEAAAKMLPGDHIRITRALEVHALTGKRFSEWAREWEVRRPRFSHRLLVLCGRREWLRNRIAQRSRQMLAEGWTQEVQTLLERGTAPEDHCFKALGYREIAEHLEGKMSREALEERIIILTGQFARRQMIWLRGEKPATWVAACGKEALSPLTTLEKLLANAGIAHV